MFHLTFLVERTLTMFLCIWKTYVLPQHKHYFDKFLVTLMNTGLAVAVLQTPSVLIH